MSSLCKIVPHCGQTKRNTNKWIVCQLMPNIHNWFSQPYMISTFLHQLSCLQIFSKFQFQWFAHSEKTMVLRIVRSKTQINIVSNTATTSKVIWFSSLNNQEKAWWHFCNHKEYHKVNLLFCSTRILSFLAKHLTISRNFMPL